MKQLAVVVLSTLALACGPAPAVKAPPTSRAQASTGGLTVELLSHAPLAVGQNRVFYRVTRDGEAVTHAHLAQKPVMHMTSKSHACPLQDPGHEANADGLFEGLIIFNMASMDMEHWTLGVDVTVGHETTAATVDLGEVAVADSPSRKVLTRDTKKVILSFGFADTMKVGNNDVVVTAHQATDMTMMNFATVDDLVFTLTPEMPSMGHGSSGNVNPTRGEDGLYRGSVNFSMPGDWVVHLGVLSGDAELGTFDFAYDL